MEDRTIEQIGDGGQADMRMRGHINTVAGLEFYRSHVIKKHKRTDRTYLAVR